MPDAANEVRQLRAELAAARQQLAQAAAAQEAFMRRVVHDLRAPLRHVTSYAQLVSELLQEVPQPPEPVREARQCLQTLERSGRRMAQMLEGLQALAEVERAPLQPARVGWGQALSEARALLAAAEAGRAIHWEVAGEAPALQADPALLRTLLVQLLDNAVKFTRTRAEARITVQARPGPAGQVRLTVQDNGAGFDPERSQQLFGMFERLHRESEFEGVGAGLALCQAIAQRHGAAIHATARPGAGCTVQLDWPAAPPP